MIWNREINFVSPLESLKQDDIVFNGFSLSNNKIRVNKTDFYSLPKRKIKSYNNPRSDGWGVSFAKYSEKTVSFTWSINAETKEEFNEILDDIKKYCDKVEWYLDIRINWSIRRAKCTLSSFSPEINNYNITNCIFSISFLSLEPYFYEIKDDYLVFEDTTSSFNSEIKNLWKWKTFPSLFIIFKEVQNSSNLAFWIWDEKIKINRSFNVWDFIEINWYEEKVLVNWDEVNYSGIFPELQTDYNDFMVNIDWKFRIDAYLLYKKTYK